MNPISAARAPLAALLMLTLASSAFATRLTFDKSPTQFAFPNPFFGPVSTNVYSDYGDNVTASDLVSGQDVSAAHGAGVTYHYGNQGGATPDITVDYLGPVNDPNVGASGMKAYTDSNFPLGLLPHLTLTNLQRLFVFTCSDPNDVVSLLSFDVYKGGFAHPVDNLRVVRINSDSSETVLFSTGPTSLGPANVTFDFTSAPLEGSVLAIDMDPGTGTGHNNFVYDNITFAQVPEPAMVSVAMVGLTSALMRRRVR